MSAYFILELLKALQKSLVFRICHTSSEDKADSGTWGKSRYCYPILHFV